MLCEKIAKAVEQPVTDEQTDRHKADQLDQ